MDFLYLLEGLRTPWLDGIVSALTHLGGEMMFLIWARWCSGAWISGRATIC